jgi:hypothetical protein
MCLSSPTLAHQGLNPNPIGSCVSVSLGPPADDMGPPQWLELSASAYHLESFLTLSGMALQEICLVCMLLSVGQSSVV